MRFQTAFFHQFGFAAACVRDGRTDDDGDFPRIFQKGVFRPKFAAVEGDGDDVHLKHFRHARAAEFVFAALSGRKARAFGENGNPIAFVFARQPLFYELLVGFAAVVAVYAYGFDQFQAPAEKGDFEQLAFGNVNLRRKNVLKGKRFPAALVFGADDGGAVGDVFRADDAVFEPDDVFEREVEDFDPDPRHLVRPVPERRGEQHKGKEENQAGTEYQPVNQVADDEHGFALSECGMFSRLAVRCFPA